MAVATLPRPPPAVHACLRAASSLEWQVCAATGRLPGQGSSTIRFAYAPKRLPYARIGLCTGYVPNGCYSEVAARAAQASRLTQASCPAWL